MFGGEVLLDEGSTHKICPIDIPRHLLRFGVLGMLLGSKYRTSGGVWMSRDVCYSTFFLCFNTPLEHNTKTFTNRL